MIRLRKKGDKSVITFKEPTNEKSIAKIRKEEANLVADLIKADRIFLDFQDRNIPTINNNSIVFKLVDLIRKLKPTIILTHWYQESHKDHINTSKLILKSFNLSNSMDYKTKHYPHKVRILGFWNERGRKLRPNFYLNVSNQVKQIKIWGKCYKSQSFRLVGRFAKYRYRFNSLRTPYYFVEGFNIFGMENQKIFGEFFP